VRIVREYHEKVQYIHLHPVRRGLVDKPEDWRWSSMGSALGSARKNRSAAAGYAYPIPLR
jgi:hypothetical protein